MNRNTNDNYKYQNFLIGFLINKNESFYENISLEIYITI